MNRLAIAFVVSLLAACEPPPPPIPGEITGTGTVIATVNGKPVHQDILDLALKDQPPEKRAELEKSGQIEQLKEQVVLNEVLYQEAIKAKVHEKPDMKLALALAERGALVNEFMADTIKARMTEDVLKAWYTDHLVQFSRPQVKLSQIAVQTEDEAKAVMDELAKGAAFADVARAKSKDPQSAAEGGSMGWFSQRDLREPLASQAFGTEKGKTAGPIQIPAGFLILYVEDRRDQIPFEEVRDQIEGQARNEVIRKYIDEVKAAAKIEQAGAAPAAPTDPAAPGAPAPAAPPAGEAPAAGGK